MDKLLLSVVGVQDGVDWVKLFIPPLLTGVVMLLGLWIWHCKRRSEPRYQSINYLNQKRLDGLLRVWSLLGYLTEVENPRAVLIWEKQGGQTTWFLRPQQAREYIEVLSDVFYAEGLLLDGEIKERLFEYRGLVYGVMLKEDCGQDDRECVELKNDQLVNRLKRLYIELNQELREALKMVES